MVPLKSPYHVGNVDKQDIFRWSSGCGRQVRRQEKIVDTFSSRRCRGEATAMSGSFAVKAIVEGPIPDGVGGKKQRLLLQMRKR